MATSVDLRQIVDILIEEGFGLLAGELLAEISAGRQVEVRRSAQASGGDEEADTFVTRVPIPAEEQLGEAMSYLRLRLVAPVRALAEAERLAGELAKSPATRIRFIDPAEHYEVEPLSLRDPGDGSLAEKLDLLLHRLATTTAGGGTEDI